MKREAGISEGGIRGGGIGEGEIGEGEFEMKGICLRFQPNLRNL